MIPCYVSGKGMYATGVTRAFKVAVILALDQSGLGYDTRYRYYRNQFPEIGAEELAKKICAPIEYYDKDWKPYLKQNLGSRDEREVLAEFVFERDAQFRNEASFAIYCYDEAGLGSGINCMRFIREGKPILGFYNPESAKDGANLTNIMQLKYEAPHLVTLITYNKLGEVPERIVSWIKGLEKS